MNKDTILLIGGLLTLVGGVAMLWSSVREYRRGEPSARSRIVTAGALAVYGALTLSGVMFTIAGAVAVWVIAALVWVGLHLSFRDRRRARQGR